jgi:hypothetical protein
MGMLGNDAGHSSDRTPTNHAWREPGNRETFSDELRQAAAKSSWSEVLDLFRDHGETPAQGREKVVAMGDIHGASAENVGQDLRRVGLLARTGRWRNPYNLCFIQTGDVVDRGSQGREVYNLLGKLQSQSDGRLIRLLGNHEQFHLLSIPEHMRAPELPGFREQLMEDILAGRVILAWTEGDVIYSHAGIDLDFYPEYRGRTNPDIVTDLNARLAAAVQEIQAHPEVLTGDFARHAFARDMMAKHAIFDSKRSILWTRDNIENSQFRQVVGHTPQLDGIQAAPGMRVKYIDAGRVFGEEGLVDPERARSIMTNTVLDGGLRYLAAHPEVFRRHKEEKRE